MKVYKLKVLQKHYTKFKKNVGAFSVCQFLFLLIVTKSMDFLLFFYTENHVWEGSCAQTPPQATPAPTKLSGSVQGYYRTKPQAVAVGLLEYPTQSTIIFIINTLRCIQYIENHIWKGSCVQTPSQATPDPTKLSGRVQGYYRTKPQAVAAGLLEYPTQSTTSDFETHTI